jgi:Ran-binding protein 9/10
VRVQPGWRTGSWGYHGDDGRLFHDSTWGRPFGPTFTTDDVIGCGLDFRRRLIFYTKNGKLLDAAARNLSFKPPLEPEEDDVYPLIGLHSDEERVRVNFGKEPFLFNIGKYVKSILSSTLTDTV